ncbi:MAG: mannitol-1-phosphate 5-dehydrogenase [Bacteroidia bacterium]|nr:mannitol-1-phosphate 5-dehydrogenase [Bacteroidia bacterium]
MQHTGNGLRVDPHKIVIFGAGRIGRSFIGQLFGCSGYQVTFVDVDTTIVRLLNEKKSYRVVIKGDRTEEIIVPNISAIHAADTQKVSETVCSAGIAAVSVGKFALEKVIPLIASGLELRHKHNPYFPLDIILAENMRSAAEFTKEHLLKHLPDSYPVDMLVGLIETSIGKMVPIIPLAEIEKDPLVVFAEPYNSLILDANGFKTPVPDVKGLAPKSNIKAWVDRKAFIHNLGHATAAYYGHFLHPQMTYMYDVLDDKLVLDFTRDVMMQSARVLNKAYSDDLPMKDLTDHVEDLLNRFRNRVLQDTIFRVGHDLVRKLGSDDRFMGAVHLAIQYSMPYDLIIKAMSYGFRFKARNEEGQLYPDDENFLVSVSENPVRVFTDILSFDAEKEQYIINQLIKLVK